MSDLCMFECMSRLHVNMDVIMHVKMHVRLHVRGIRFADAILNGEICPFQKGGLSPSLFLPKIERGGVSRSADRDEGAALDLPTFEKVRSKL